MRFTNFTTIACSVQICNFTPLANSMYSMPNNYITRVNIETRPKVTKVIYLQRQSDMKKSTYTQYLPNLQLGIEFIKSIETFHH